MFKLNYHIQIQGIYNAKYTWPQLLKTIRDSIHHIFTLTYIHAEKEEGTCPRCHACAIVRTCMYIHDDVTATHSCTRRIPVPRHTHASHGQASMHAPYVACARSPVQAIMESISGRPRRTMPSWLGNFVGSPITRRLPGGGTGAGRCGSGGAAGRRSGR